MESEDLETLEDSEIHCWMMSDGPGTTTEDDKTSSLKIVKKT